MEDILFDSYRKYLKESHAYVKSLSKMPLVVWILLASLFLCGGGSVGFLYVSKCQILSPIMLVAEIILCIVLHFYVENYRIITSDIRVGDYSNYCKDVMQWLTLTGVVASPSNLTELRKRILETCESQEIERKRKVENVEKWVQVLIIPLLLAGFYKIIDEQQEVDALMSWLFVLICFVIFGCVMVLGIYNAVSFLRKYKLEKMRRFANDIQGIIDTQFEDGFLKKETQETKV